MTTMIVEQTNIEQEQLVRPALSAIFEVGDWRVIPELNRLQHNSAASTRQLEHRLIKLLCFLAANADKVLSREELIQELWPHVVVNENSLTRAISELRKQLRTTNAATGDYIETIPKSGYRLALPVNSIGKKTNQHTASTKENHWNEIPHLPGRFFPWHYGSAITAVCFSLLIATGLMLGGSMDATQQADETLLADEVLKEKTDFLGGKITLSMLSDTPDNLKSMTSPVLSMNKMQYAFIQYDNNGSTIFLGDLGAAPEPVAIFNSPRRLFNLTWSPVGNNLLFAVKPFITTAIYSPINAIHSATNNTTGNEAGELLMLNLNTLETSRLVQDAKAADADSGNSPNLT